MPEKKTDVIEEKPEVSNFEMDQKYIKELDFTHQICLLGYFKVENRMRNSNEMTMEKTHRTLEHILKSHKDVQRPRSHGQIMVQCNETRNGQRIFSKTFKIRFAKTRR